ncbi:MAG: hypothetical protein KAX38_06060 [Candidatus Krumholzibacteria bacterium]|nr:hypothetical protein [Candidatus Krumholzibacteria bacterium]
MHKEHKHSPVPGLILVALGILFLLGNFGAFRIDTDIFWTYIIIVLGIIFWLVFLFDRSKSGHIMPGTILLTVGLLLNYAVRNGWGAMKYLWPFFILAPAFGFYAMFLFGGRDRTLLIPAGILTVIGLVFFLQGFDHSMRLIWPIAIIIIGVLLLVKGSKKEEG